MPSPGVKIIAGRWEVKFRPAVLNIRAYKAMDVKSSCNLHQGKLQIKKRKR